HDGRAAAVYQRAGSLGGSREAVAVADGQYRDAALARGGIGQAVAQALAGFDAAHLLHAGLEAERGLQARPAGRVGPAKAAHAVEGYAHARVGAAGVGVVQQAVTALRVQLADAVSAAA